MLELHMYTVEFRHRGQILIVDKLVHIQSNTFKSVLLRSSH